MSETDDHYASATIEEGISASVSNVSGKCSKIGCNCNSFTPNYRIIEYYQLLPSKTSK